MTLPGADGDGYHAYPVTGNEIYMKFPWVRDRARRAGSARARAASALALALVVGAAAGCSHLVLLHDPLTAAEHNDLGVAYETAGKDYAYAQSSDEAKVTS